MEKIDIVIYHAGCFDGFCSAWLLYRNYPDAEFIPAKYNTKPPDVTGKNVIIVDFSYSRDIVLDMCKKANNLYILDHHKTAMQNLDGLDFCKFDMTKSGARLTWEHLKEIGKEDRLFSPWLVDYTEDRDLWLWKLPNSRAVNAHLQTYPFDFKTWDWLNEQSFHRFVDGGNAIIREQSRLIDQAVYHAHIVLVDGQLWNVTNCTSLVSETAGRLAKNTGIGCCWFELCDGSRVYSLRTTDQHNIDVSVIAEKFGGGGHINASSFTINAKNPHPWIANQM